MARRVPPAPSTLPGGGGDPGPLARMQSRFARAIAWSTRQTATSATAGTNGAVPAQVAGYLLVELVDSTTGKPSVKKVPYFN
jgi:hypothetical protein